MTDIFENRITNQGKTRVPVWFMRQAGRYHDHYQNLKKSHTFMELCKKPELACEVTMGQSMPLTLTPPFYFPIYCFLLSSLARVLFMTQPKA